MAWLSVAGAQRTRRSLFRAAGISAAMAACGGVLSGCRLGVQSTPRPTNGSTKTILVLRPYVDDKVPHQLVYEWTAPFRAKNPGIDVTFQSFQPLCCDESGNITAISAGKEPDIVALNELTSYMEQDLLQPLDPLIKASGINTDLINTGQNPVHSRDGHLYALPTTQGAVAYVMNIGAMDEAGLPPPSASWTHTEAAQLWTNLTKVSTRPEKRRWGADFFWAFGPRGPNECYLKGFGGGYVDPNNAARCFLDDEKSMEAGEWLFGLIGAGVCQPGPSDWSEVLSGKVVFRCVGNWAMVHAVTQLYPSGLKWDFQPFPVWPTGPATATNRDGYAIPTSTKHLEAAWELLSWMTFEPPFQQGLMSAWMTVPVLKSLSAEWASRLVQLAPPLKGKNLSAFTSAVSSGHLEPNDNFQYNDQRVGQIIGAMMGRIMSQNISVRDGFAQVADQVNRIETSLASLTAAQRLNVETPPPVPRSAPVQYGTPWDTAIGLKAGDVLAQVLQVQDTFVGVGVSTPTYYSVDSGYTVTLRQGSKADGQVLASQAFVDVVDNSWNVVELRSPQPAGTYTIELSKPTGTKVGWWLNSHAQPSGAQALRNGKPISGQFAVEYYPKP